MPLRYSLSSSGYGKVVSILATSNDQSYAKNIDEVLENLKLDKTKSPLKNNTVSTPSTGTNKL